MTAELATALQITAVGMGLVFALICALWGGMALLVRLTADRAPAPEAAPGATPEGADDRELRRRSAALAVAVALAREAAQTPGWLAGYTAPPTASVSPWQAVARGNQLRSRGRVRR